MSDAEIEVHPQKTNPSKFLSEIIGSSVTVKLHNGIEFLGNLQSIDGYMNIVLDQTKELSKGTVIRSYEDVFIRGNNGMYLSILCYCVLECAAYFNITAG